MEKSSATPNVTVLTPPPAISLSRTVLLPEQSNTRRSSDAAAVCTGQATCEQNTPVPAIIISHPVDEKTNDKAGSAVNCDVSDNGHGMNLQCNNGKEVQVVQVDEKMVNIPAVMDRNNDELLDVHQRSAEVDEVVDLCTQTHADGSLVGCTVKDVDAAMSDGSFHLDTQMLCAVAGPAASEDDKIVNIVQPALPTTDNNQLMSESLLDMSSELELNSAMCQFMKEFSTQKCAAQINAAIDECNKDGETGRGCAVSVPLETLDLSVNNTCELVASGNFDQIYAASDDNRQIVYSEEMLFDDGKEVTGRLPAIIQQNVGRSKHIASDMAENCAPDDCIENKSDLFASYIEEPDFAVRADVCSGDLPPAPGSSFVIAHDSLTSTMFDRAMAAVNQAVVGRHSNADKCPPPVDGDASSNVVSGSQQKKSQPDVLLSRNAEPFDVDAEAALDLLCQRPSLDLMCVKSSHKAPKKPPKRRGRKRKSDSFDPLRRSGTSDVEEKRRRTLSGSPALPADGERADLSLNQAVCFSVSSGSTSDSSAYVPPTPPSTAAEKSNVNTPRRLLGGVSGVTPVKFEQSAHRFCEVKENVSASKGCENKEVVQREADVALDGEVKVGGSLAPPTQGLPSTQSFTIIDVAANRLLFDTFIAEWRQQTSFSLSLACEKHPKPQAQHSRRSKEGIGARFAAPGS